MLKLKDIAKTMGITEKEALKRLFADDVETMKKAEDNWAKIEKRLIGRAKGRCKNNSKQTK